MIFLLVRFVCVDVFDEVITVEPLKSSSKQNLDLLGRPDLYWTFTKLHLWSLTQYSKVVFLDADTLVLKNVDDLFEQISSSGAEGEEAFAACPDIGWPDCFNSGVFVTKPSQETFYKLLAFGETEGSFDGGDQGLLNDYFNGRWKRLSFLYNVTPSASYTYAPAYKRFGSDIKIVHFIGADKPWRWERYSNGGVAPKGRNSDVVPLVQRWWDVYDEKIGKFATDLNALSYGQSHGPAGGYYGNIHGSSGHGSNQGGSSQHGEGFNPFFKSRYDWNEHELKLPVSKPGVHAPSSADSEDEHKIPLKKSAVAVKPAAHAASNIGSKAAPKKK